MTGLRFRKYAMLLLVGVIAVGLASCGRQQQTAATNTPPTPNENESVAQSAGSDESQAAANDTPESIFTTSFGLSWPGWEDVRPEISLHPGESIYFKFRVKNNSSEPVECPKVAIEPVSSLGLVEERLRIWGSDGLIIARKTFKNLGTGVPMQVANAAYFGVSNPPKSSMGGKLNPANNQYYDARTAALWSSGDAIWLLVKKSQFGTSSMPIGFGGSLILSRSAKPGTDLVFTGYIVVKGQKQEVGTVTVHVVNPD